MKKFLLVVFIGMVLVTNLCGLVKEIITEDVEEPTTVIYLG